MALQLGLQHDEQKVWRQEGKRSALSGIMNLEPRRDDANAAAAPAAPQAVDRADGASSSSSASSSNERGARSQIPAPANADDSDNDDDVQLELKSDAAAAAPSSKASTGKIKRKKSVRAAKSGFNFDSIQLRGLKENFRQDQYPSSDGYEEVADAIGMPDVEKVKAWYRQARKEPGARKILVKHGVFQQKGHRPITKPRKLKASKSAAAAK